MERELGYFAGGKGRAWIGTWSKGDGGLASARRSRGDV